MRRGVRSRAAPARNTAPWLLATAAVLLAVVGWWPRFGEFAAEAAVAGGLGQWQAHRARERMLRTAGVGHWAWGGASEVGAGDIVWDATRQRGFLRLRSFVPNDPARARYQLWIFDAARDERHPVAGGVFDVPADLDEVVIPLHPTLPVSRAAAFAVTIEKPEGAVVPNRDKVVAFARAGT